MKILKNILWFIGGGVVSIAFVVLLSLTLPFQGSHIRVLANVLTLLPFIVPVLVVIYFWKREQSFAFGILFFDILMFIALYLGLLGPNS